MKLPFESIDGIGVVAIPFSDDTREGVDGARGIVAEVSSSLLFSKWTEGVDGRLCSGSPRSPSVGGVRNFLVFSLSTTCSSFLTASIDSWGGFAW